MVSFWRNVVEITSCVYTKTIINCAAMGRARFIIYLRFIFFRCRVERPRPPLGRIHSAVLKIGLNHAICYICMSKSCWNIDTRIMLWICKIYFVFVIFVFIRVAFEENNKYAKKVFWLSQPWSSAFTFAMWEYTEKHDKIVSTLQGYFGQSDSLVLRVFFVFLDSPRPTLNHAVCSVYSPNVVEI